MDPAKPNLLVEKQIPPCARTGPFFWYFLSKEGILEDRYSVPTYPS